MDFNYSQGVTHMNGPSQTQGVHFAQSGAQNVVAAEDAGVERLVLGAGGDVAVQRQVAEELPQLPLTPRHEHPALTRCGLLALHERWTR
jgi:hypothetical protein